MFWENISFIDVIIFWQILMLIIAKFSIKMSGKCFLDL